MNWVVFVAMVLCGVAHADKKEYAPVTVDWAAKRLSDVVTLQCDDSYYSGVELTVPGSLSYPEWYISYEDCAVDWKLLSRRLDTDSKTGAVSTVLKFEGGSRCVIKVRQQVKRPAQPKIFTLEVSDAC